MKLQRVATLILCLSLSLPGCSQPGTAIGDVSIDKEGLEIPSTSGKDTILEYKGFTVKYNSSWLIPSWVAYEITREEAEGSLERSGSFGMDMSYRGRQAMREDYSNSGWDKGHMAPAGDMKWDRKAMTESFYLTNICPQNHKLNSGDWNHLENLVRGWARKYGSVYVICGPLVSDSSFGTIGQRKVQIPDGFFKAVLRVSGGYASAIAFVFENTAQKQPVRRAAMSVDELEGMLGIDLFEKLPDSLENKIEASFNLSEWGL